MPSLVTSVIGGFQGASAARNAAKAQRQGYADAGRTVNDAVSAANPAITDAAKTAGAGVTNAAATAGAGVTDAASAAGSGVTSAAGGANNLLNPYIQNGTAAGDKLSNLNGIADFNFNPSDLENTPGYQFALKQGLRGVNSAAGASGLRGSGSTLKAAAGYAQGLASTTYNQQYDNALKAYNANLGNYQAKLNTYMPQYQMGLGASGQAGSNLVNAAQYTGNTGMAGAEYAGNAGMSGAQYAGNAGMWAGGQTAQNLINAGVYTGNTQIGSGNATAQGDIGAANSWNSMLGGIGTAGNMALMAGFGNGQNGTSSGWSPSNMSQNFGSLIPRGAGAGAGGPAMPYGSYGPSLDTLMSGVGPTTAELAGGIG